MISNIINIQIFKPYNIQPIGKGSYGNVVRANLKNSNHHFALKFFIIDKQTLKEVVNDYLIFDIRFYSYVTVYIFFYS